MEEQISKTEAIEQGTEIVAIAMRLIGTENHSEIDGIRQTIKGLLYTARLIETLGPIAVEQAIELGMDRMEIEMIGLEVAEGR